MARVVAFLGSINVGGNRLTMADLRWAFEREGFENVETVVASGNVLFDFDERPTDGLEELFAHMMAERFDIDSFVAVRTPAEIAAALAGNPFAADGAENKVHTVFLAGPLDRAAFDAFAAAYPGPERLAAGTHCFHVDYAEGVGRSALDPAMRKARLGLPRGTARNLRSMRRILDKMDQGTAPAGKPGAYKPGA